MIAQAREEHATRSVSFIDQVNETWYCSNDVSNKMLDPWKMVKSMTRRPLPHAVIQTGSHTMTHPFHLVGVRQRRCPAGAPWTAMRSKRFTSSHRLTIWTRS